jgi:hypothetical protein
LKELFLASWKSRDDNEMIDSFAEICAACIIPYFIFYPRLGEVLLILYDGLGEFEEGTCDGLVGYLFCFFRSVDH